MSIKECWTLRYNIISKISIKVSQTIYDIEKTVKSKIFPRIISNELKTLIP